MIYENTLTGRIKILFIIFSLDKGGAEKIFSFLANNINSDKFEIHFLTIKQARGDAFVLGPTVNHIKLNYSRVLFSFWAVYKHILKLNPNVVLSTLIPVNIIVGLFKKMGFLKNSKYILRESSIPSINGKFSKNRYFFYNSLISILYKEFDVVVAQSLDMKSDLLENYLIDSKKIKVINNPYFETPFLLVKDPPLQMNIGKKIFINIGNLRIEKGHIRLIEAIAILKGKLAFELWILGDGVMMNLLKQRIVELQLEEHVKLLGHQSDVLPLLEKADLYLQTSQYEGFPNVLLEALGLGIPIVAYDVLGGTKDIVQNGFNGFLVPDGEAEIFCSFVLKAVSHTFNKDAIKEHVKSTFSAKVIIKKYENLILGTLNL